MKLGQPITLAELAAILDGKYVGQPEVAASGINEIHVVEAGDIVFVDHPKYYDKTLASPASIVIINKELECPPGKGLIIHPEPFTAFNKAIRHFQPLQFNASQVASNAVIGEGSRIHPSAVIGSDVVIGKQCTIHPNVVIGDRSIIGDRVEIHPNTTIGGDAFYYKKRPSGFEKLQTCGRVVIEDDVEIGAGCCIDKGVTGNTVIGAGTKFDNMVHIGHDTRIGKRCLFAAQVGIAGCVVVEDEVTMWGQVGCIANVTIGKGAIVMAQSGVGKSLAPGKTYFGSPAGEARKKLKELATLSMLSKPSD